MRRKKGATESLKYLQSTRCQDSRATKHIKDIWLRLHHWKEQGTGSVIDRYRRCYGNVTEIGSPVAFDNR